MEAHAPLLWCLYANVNGVVGGVEKMRKDKPSMVKSVTWSFPLPLNFQMAMKVAFRSVWAIELRNSLDRRVTDGSADQDLGSHSIP